MVRRKSNSRLSSVVLMQTDTTVGFISQNHTKLADIKSRPNSKPFIKVINSFKKLRVPKKYKNEIRRSKKTTFIVSNKAFRVSNETQNSQLLRDISWHYSTSANEANKNFDRKFCEENADIIIENCHGLHELGSSKLIKLTNHKKRRLR